MWVGPFAKTALQRPYSVATQSRACSQFFLRQSCGLAQSPQPCSERQVSNRVQLDPLFRHIPDAALMVAGLFGVRKLTHLRLCAQSVLSVCSVCLACRSSRGQTQSVGKQAQSKEQIKDSKREGRMMRKWQL